MVFNHTYRIGLEDCGKENEATNKAILTIQIGRASCRERV